MSKITLSAHSSDLGPCFYQLTIHTNVNPLISHCSTWMSARHSQISFLPPLHPPLPQKPFYPSEHELRILARLRGFSAKRPWVVEDAPHGPPSLTRGVPQPPRQAPAASAGAGALGSGHLTSLQGKMITGGDFSPPHFGFTFKIQFLMQLCACYLVQIHVF